jgi:D-sedoheptulose 7-phosphate isomerase
LEAVVLCGGRGERLRSVLADRPKPLAPVQGRPFLEWLLLALAGRGLRRVVLATGYGGEAILQALGDGRRLGVELAYSQEPEPLGTGGALRLAAAHTSGTPLLVLNGDSYCRFDLSLLWARHRERSAQATLWLQAQPDAARYGNVDLNREGRIIRFSEKEDGRRPFSCGVYLIERALIESIPADRAVSLEHDVFPSLAGAGLFGVLGQGPFLDIGTPESLGKADTLLRVELESLPVTQHQVEYGRTYLEEGLEVQRRSLDACLGDLVEAANAVARCLRAGGKVMLCGNGGSAADCQHVATELVCRLSRTLKRPALAALALTTDSSILTAYGNDFGFEGVFARQVEGLGRKGDVLIAISTSGRSANVLRAVETARRQGITTIGLLGQGGPLRDGVDHAVVVPDSNTQHVQESLLPLEHLLCDLVEQSLYGGPAREEAGA